MNVQPTVAGGRAQGAWMNREFVSQRRQRQEFGRAATVVENMLCELQQGLRCRAASAVQRSIGLERDVEESRKRSLGVAGGHSHLTDRWHAPHSAIVRR